MTNRGMVLLETSKVTKVTKMAVTLNVREKFWFDGADHIVLIKNKTNLQIKNIRTGKVQHIINIVNI